MNNGGSTRAFMMRPASCTVVYGNIKEKHHPAHCVGSYFLCHFCAFDQVESAAPVADQSYSLNPLRTSRLLTRCRRAVQREQYGGPMTAKVVQCEQRMSNLLQIKS